MPSLNLLSIYFYAGSEWDLLLRIVNHILSSSQGNSPGVFLSCICLSALSSVRIMTFALYLHRIGCQAMPANVQSTAKLQAEIEQVCVTSFLLVAFATSITAEKKISRSVLYHQLKAEAQIPREKVSVAAQS